MAPFFAELLPDENCTALRAIDWDLGSTPRDRTTHMLEWSSWGALAVFVPLVICYLTQPVLRSHGGKLLMSGICIGQIFTISWAFARFLPVDSHCDFFNWLWFFSLAGREIFYCATAIYLLAKTRNPFTAGRLGIYFAAATCTAALFATVQLWARHGHGGNAPCACTRLFIEDNQIDVHIGSMSLSIFLSALLWIAAPLAIIIVVYAMKFVRVSYSMLQPITKVYIRGLYVIIVVDAGSEMLCTLVMMFLREYSVWAEAEFEICADGFLRMLPCVVWLVVHFQGRKNRIQGHKQKDSGEKRLGRALRARLLDLLTQAIRQSADDVDDAAKNARGSFEAEAHLGMEPINMDDESMFDDRAQAWALAPRVFRELRSIFKIGSESFKSSLEERSTERFTEGRSGAFMYFSCDNRFIIKTATPGEWNLLMSVLPSYYEHNANCPNSLINHIVGAFELHLLNHKLRVIMVESCFKPGLEIHERYDLKGSWVGRRSKKDQASEKTLPWDRDYGNSGHFKVKGVLKDLDIHSPLLLPPDVASRLGQQLRLDIDFLARNDIMDYSILLGVTKSSFPVLAQDRKDTGLSCLSVGAVEGPYVYSIGVIDVLQDFNLRKKIEFCFKRYVRCQGPGVSVHPPGDYAQRMVENVVEPLIERSQERCFEDEADGESGSDRGRFGICCGSFSATPSDTEEEEEDEEEDASRGSVRDAKLTLM